MGGQATQPVFQPDSYPLSNDLTITRWSHAACFTLVAWARRQPSQLSHGSLWGWSATGDRFLRALICRRWAGIAATAVSGLVGVSRQIGIDEFVIELPAKTT